MNVKRGQVTIFIIVALIVVGAVIVYLAVNGSFSTTSTGGDFAPVFTAYQQCIESQTKAAVSLASLQGGHVSLGDYIPGSDYAPFSSHLSYLGSPVPYWFYVSGNNLVKENVPSLTDMQKDISSYVSNHLHDCDLSVYEAQGYSISIGKPEVSTLVSSKNVVTTVRGAVTVSREGSTESKSINEASVSSKLGTFYAIAKNVYDKEKQEAFIEKYAVDVLRLYAPVDGVNVQCAPGIWKSREVVSAIQDGLVNNLASLEFAASKPKGEAGYFTVPLSTSEPVRIIYSKSWPSVVEITPADQELMIAEPVGNQQGMGVMGFCYVPYHFVYDLKFPVMVQIGDGLDFFQFPIAAIVNKNVARNALPSTFDTEDTTNVCAFANSKISVSVYDADLKPVQADVSYQCFDQTCPVGESAIANGVSTLNAFVPSCVNGKLLVDAEGYAHYEKTFSSNEEHSAEVILDKEYDVRADLKLNGKSFGGTAIVHFESATGVESTALPDNPNIKLHEGLYNITIYAYGNASIKIPASTKTQCTDVSRGGILGFFGSKKEQCFTITVPESVIDSALVGGGKTTAYLFSSDLQKGTIMLDAQAFESPTSLEDVQYTFNALDDASIEVSFK
jgi:hypothetical protein